MKFSPKWFYIFQSPVDDRMYLGQTMQSLEKYRGSGVSWSKHVKKYGEPVLLFSRWCETSEIFQELLNTVEKDYPNYWESPVWFNKVPEVPWDSVWQDKTHQSFAGKRGGKALKESGKLAANLKACHEKRTTSQLAKGGSVVSNSRVSCPECGKLSSPGGLGMHRKFKHLGGQLSEANLKQLNKLHNKEMI